MIITRISGGLGNQLFQYSLGRNLAEKHHAPLVLDTSFYKDQRGMSAVRSFTLQHFTITATEATAGDFKKAGLPDASKDTLLARVHRNIFRLSEKYTPTHNKKFILESDFVFTPDILNTKDNIFLSGVWQSEKYFKNIEPIIRREFTLKEPLSFAAEEIKERARRCNSISLHIRRGDYVLQQKTSTFHGVCSMEYYKKGVMRIAERVSEPVIFVFSDDIAWAKENLTLGYPFIFVSDNEIPDYEELILMSSCKHHIIANSSFSWWGAWLNPDKEKIVIAPSAWFSAGQTDTRDLLSESWIKI